MQIYVCNYLVPPCALLLTIAPHVIRSRAMFKLPLTQLSCKAV